MPNDHFCNYLTLKISVYLNNLSPKTYFLFDKSEDVNILVAYA